MKYSSLLFYPEVQVTDRDFIDISPDVRLEGLITYFSFAGVEGR